jgi:hypothetical protein
MWGGAILIRKYEQSDNIGLIKLGLKVQNLRLQELVFISNACGHKKAGHEEMKLSCFKLRGVLKNTKTQNILPCMANTER